MLKPALAMFFCALFAVVALAETAEEKGLAIVMEADRRDAGWIDSTADMRMILRNKQGQESERILRIKSREVEGDGDQSLTIFDTPRDVKGTAFLSYTHALTADDQWLYLPALKRVKRISSSNKSGPFMGSEFAFEDLTSFEVEKYTYKWLRDEALDGVDCFVIEYYPAYQHSGYTRQLAWVNKDTYQPERVEFYDRKNALLKTLSYKGYQQYQSKFWRPGVMHMVNHQTGKETDIYMENYKFANGFSDRDFDQNSLKEAR
ncbi:MAG: outer membrane lipoprotein-sorting protein [Porticoccaceae bacterium]